MTGPGTNTYLLGDAASGIAVIDPGPAFDAHVQAIVDAAAGPLHWILCTHTHVDHSPAAAPLKARTGATVLGMRARYPERQDATFAPDRELTHGARLEVGGHVLRVLHTPGHASNQLCFLEEGERLLFTGDHLMQGSTVVINPPDGDMAVYLASLRLLLEESLEYIAPGHGFLMGRPHEMVERVLVHRVARENKVLAAAQSACGAEIAVDPTGDKHLGPTDVPRPARAFQVPPYCLRRGDGRLELPSRVAARAEYPTIQHRMRTAKSRCARNPEFGGLDGRASQNKVVHHRDSRGRHLRGQRDRDRDILVRRYGAGAERAHPDIPITAPVARLRECEQVAACVVPHRPDVPPVGISGRSCRGRARRAAHMEEIVCAILRHHVQVVPGGDRLIGTLMLALLAYFFSLSLGGNGFIAAFVGGMFFGSSIRKNAHHTVELTESAGILLSVFVWAIFGGYLVIPLFINFNPLAFLYGVLSLTLIRMLPVALSLLGLRFRRDTVGEMGWFGPRGLASVIFGLLAFDELTAASKEAGLLASVVTWTILLSVLTHGLSAQPVAAWYARRLKNAPAAVPELVGVPEIQVRSDALLSVTGKAA